MAERVDRSITRLCQIGGMFLLGWLSSSAWYGTGTFTKVEKVLPVIQAEAGCEHWRARRTENLALATEMVSPSEIPKDNCPRPK